MKILTNDPSTTAWGWAVLDEEGQVLASGCIQTEPSDKKLRIRKGDDRVRRAQEINLALLSIIREWQVDLIISELPHGSQSASAAAMLYLVVGILQALADSLDISIEWYYEIDVKKTLFNRRSVAKEETVEKILPLYHVPYSGKKYIDQAVADALSIHWYATQYSPTLKMFKTFKNKTV